LSVVFVRKLPLFCVFEGIQENLPVPTGRDTRKGYKKTAPFHHFFFFFKGRDRLGYQFYDGIPAFKKWLTKKNKKIKFPN
jgi:hypothetical protein